MTLQGMPDAIVPASGSRRKAFSSKPFLYYESVESFFFKGANIDYTMWATTGIIDSSISIAEKHTVNMF